MPSRSALTSDILRLAVPAFFTLIAEPLFLITDSAIIGHLGTTPLAALAAASSLLTTATGIFVFLAYATTSSVAQLMGSGRRNEGIQAGLDGAWLAVALGVPLGIATTLCAPPLSQWIGGVQAASPASTYLKISALSLPAVLLNLALTGLFRGLADTRTPLVVTTSGFITNAALNIFLVLGLHQGIAGSAWGTTISAWGMALAQLFIIVHGHRLAALQKPHLGRVTHAMREGMPLLVRTVALRGILILLTALVGSFSVTALAAHQIVSNIFTFESFALDALAIAAQTLIGHALGRGERGEIRSLTTVFLRMALWCGVGLGTIILLTASFAPRIFTSQQSVQDAALWSIILVALISPIAAVLFVLDGILMGAGDGVYLAKAQITLLLVFLIGFGVIHAAHDALASHPPTEQLLICWGLYCIILTLRTMLLFQRSRTDTWMTGSNKN